MLPAISAATAPAGLGGGGDMADGKSLITVAHTAHPGSPWPRRLSSITSHERAVASRSDPSMSHRRVANAASPSSALASFDCVGSLRIGSVEEQIHVQVRPNGQPTTHYMHACKGGVTGQACVSKMCALARVESSSGVMGPKEPTVNEWV